MNLQPPLEAGLAENARPVRSTNLILSVGAHLTSISAKDSSRPTGCSLTRDNPERFMHPQCFRRLGPSKIEALRKRRPQRLLATRKRGRVLNLRRTTRAGR